MYYLNWLIYIIGLIGFALILFIVLAIVYDFMRDFYYYLTCPKKGEFVYHLNTQGKYMHVVIGVDSSSIYFEALDGYPLFTDMSRWQWKKWIRRVRKEEKAGLL